MNSSSYNNHILQRIEEATLQKEPCPYIVIEDAFSYDHIKLINEFWPEENIFTPYSDGRNRKIGNPGRFGFYIMGHTADERAKSLDTKKREFWKNFALDTIEPLLLNLFKLFFPAISCRFEDISSLDLETFAVLVNTYESLKVGVHTDPPSFLLTTMIYLDDGYEGAGTSFYKPKSSDFLHPGDVFLDRNQFDLVHTVPYRSGTIISFVNTGQSLHGVESAVIEGRMGRRTINIHLRLTEQGIINLYGKENLERFNYPVSLDKKIMSTLDEWLKIKEFTSVEPTEKQLKPIRDSIIFEPKTTLA